MEILFTDSPAIQQEWHANSINHYFNNLVDTATHLNIATGYITNDSIAALKQIVEFRKGALKLSLFIGMHYAEGFTKPQYKALKELGWKAERGLEQMCRDAWRYVENNR